MPGPNFGHKLQCPESVRSVQRPECTISLEDSHLSSHLHACVSNNRRSFQRRLPSLVIRGIFKKHLTPGLTHEYLLRVK